MGKRLCPKTGKVGYVRHQAAAKVVGAANFKHRANVAQAPQSIYRCEHCSHWHLTSYAPERVRGIKRAVKRRAAKGAKP